MFQHLVEAKGKQIFESTLTTQEVQRQIKIHNKTLSQIKQKLTTHGQTKVLCSPNSPQLCYPNLYLMFYFIINILVFIIKEKTVLIHENNINPGIVAHIHDYVILKAMAERAQIGGLAWDSLVSKGKFSKRTMLLHPQININCYY